MINQIRLLTSLELKNFFGLNVYRHTKDAKAKRKSRLIAGCVIFALVIFLAYIVGFAYGWIILGLADVLPAYLVMLPSLIIFVFGLFKAGGMIFSQKGYDIVCYLPVSQTAIVISRFLQMYVSDLGLSAYVMIPGCIVYAIFLKPSFGFYISALISILIIPIIPLAISTLIGAAVSAVASRMKNKSFTTTILSLVVVIAVMALSFGSGAIAEDITADMLLHIADIVTELIGKLYLPALWLGGAMVGGKYLGIVYSLLLSAAVFALILFFVCRNFTAICRRLFSNSARHDYKMQTLSKNSVRKALFKRELKRYFSSAIYVTNTIIGPIMGVVFSAAVLILGDDILNAPLPMEVDFSSLVPLVMAAIMAMMPPSAVSISMEGKNFWLVKSLPLTTKEILDSKMLMTLILIAPFYVVAEILLAIALRPTFVDFIFMVLLPAAIICFVVVWSIRGNLMFYSFDWSKEETVVKQSAAAAVGGFAGIIIVIVSVVAVILVPTEFAIAVKTGLIIVLAIASVLLYCSNNKKQLHTM